MAKILIVDDEPNIVNVLSDNLEHEGYETVPAYDGESALVLAEREQPDLILLDCMLPGLDGFDVLRRIRRSSMVPVIMLTARTEEFDKVLGLELGADDYITKPFSIREVMARVKAHLRRLAVREPSEPTNDGTRLVFGDLVIDLDGYDVTLHGESIGLTLREFELLRFLATYAGQVFSREQLLEKVWGYEYFGDVRTVDVTVRRTREKLEPDQNNYRYLLTKRGVGYYFNKDCLDA